MRRTRLLAAAGLTLLVLTIAPSAGAGWTCITGCIPTPDPAPPICYHVAGGTWCQV